MFSHWLGPCLILRKKSSHTYVIDVDGVHRTVGLRVNHLRKFHPSISEVNVMIFDSDEAFGRILSVDIDSCVNEVDNIDDFPLLSHEDQCRSPCRPKDQPLPSNVVTTDQLSHLNSTQRQELCGLLDSFSECFSDKPGLCSYIEHHIDINQEFQPKRLREYRIPELMKADVQRQIDELADDGFIIPSTSPMASPLVCVLKGKDGKGGVRLAVDYKYVNSFTQNDAHVMPNLKLKVYFEIYIADWKATTRI